MKLPISILFILCLTVGNFQYSFSQEYDIEDVSYVEDVSSPKAIATAMLDLISGEKGRARNFDRLRYIFADHGTLSTISTQGDESRMISFTVEEFIERVGPQYAKTGFYENEIGLVVNEFNGSAQMMQSYEWTIPDTDQSQRGVNNYQLFKKDGRWFIHHMVWSSETEDEMIPDQYLYADQQSKKMAKVTGIGGVFFACKDPKAQAKWYEEHLGIQSEDWGGTAFKWHPIDDKETVATTTWGPFKRNNDYFKPGKKSHMINYRVDNLDELLSNLKKAGIEQVGDIDSFEYGRFAWIMDPEGNKIELWEPIDGIF